MSRVTTLPDSVTTSASAPSAHLVGICGTGMRALGEYLLDQGWNLSGSDLSATTGQIADWSSRGVSVHVGHSAGAVPDETQLLVYSAAIPESNVERQRANELGIPQVSYIQALSELTRRHPTICIAGTHGKSTVTAMLACVLNSVGLNPSMICGAELREVHRSGFAGSGDFLVLESCEYRRHFLNYQPAAALILSVEPDHFDCFPEGDASTAFAEFSALVPKGGFLIHPGDWKLPETCQARPLPLPPVSAASVSPRWNYDNIRYDSSSGLTTFSVSCDNVSCGDFQIRVPGEHNVRNALAVIMACEDIGLSAEAIRRGLLQFPGLKRRFEVRQIGARTFVDDYAHHPTAIRCLLRTARQVFPDRRLVCAFQPHQLSRTRGLLQEFVESLSLADEVLILPAFPAREVAGKEHREVSRELVHLLESTGKRSLFVGDLDHLARTLETSVTSDEIALTVGAGNIDRFYHELAEKIP